MTAATLATAILGIAANAAASELGRRVVDVLEDFRDQGNSIAYSEELVPPTMRVVVEPASTAALPKILEILEPHNLTLDAVEGVFVVIPIERPKAQSSDAKASATTKESLENITVSASRYEVDRDATSSSFAIARQAIDDMPDFGSDPIRISQRLPGVAASGASARAHFRGGELNEIGIILNGHRLFDPFHVRDYQSIFSTIDARAIDGVEIYTGGFPVQFGDRMSGVVVLESLDPDSPRHTEIGLSVFNTSFLTSSRSGDLQWLFSARRGNLDQVIDKKFGQPSYYDVFSQLEVGLGRNSVLSGNILYADDVVSIVLETDPEELEEVSSTTRSLQTWLQLRTDWSNELQSLTALSYTEYDNHRLGSTNDPEKVVAMVDDDREVVEIGVRQDWTFQPRESHRLQWGYGVSNGDAVFSYNGQAEYNGLSALFQDQPPSAARSVNAAPDGSRYFAYVADRWRFSPATVLEFGLRWDDQTYSSQNSDSQLSPRIGLLKRWSEKLDVRLSWGRYHQAQGIHELQVEDGVTDYWPAQRADQYIASLQYRFSGGTALRVEAFHKRMQKVRPRFENLFDPLALIPELQADRVQLEPSRASASGIEVSVSGSQGELDWWSSYTLSRVRDKIDGRTEPRSWDQRHAFNAGLSWSNANWDFSLAASVHSGWPTTDLMLVDAAGQQEPVAVPGSRNALRLDSFASIDFRVNRRFEFRRGTFSTFLEVSNAFNRRNTCCIDWDISDSNGDVVLENSDDYWLPLLPAIGFLWEF